MTNYHDPWPETQRLRAEVQSLKARLKGIQKPLRRLQRLAVTQTVWGWRDLWKAATEALGEPHDDAALTAAVRAYEEEQQEETEALDRDTRLALARRYRHY